jgi:hypothetical protein
MAIRAVHHGIDLLHDRLKPGRGKRLKPGRGKKKPH